MADRRFFDRAGPFTLAELATLAGAEIGGTGAPDLVVTDVAPLGAAGPDDISFLDNPKYGEQFSVSKAGACVCNADAAAAAPAGMALLICKEPYRAYAMIATSFYPASVARSGVHPRAIVDSTAIVSSGVEIGAGAVIGARAEIGSGTIIAPNAVIGDGVVIGADCVIGANASISHSIIGSKVIVYPGCCIGQDGFGFAMGTKGHLKVPQLGRVIIGNDVEIGANTTIDRGAGPDTVIGSGVRIDNLVQIGHNVTMGAACVMVAQSGISGSTELGRGVVVAGQTGIAGHLKIGDGVQIAAKSGIMRDIEPGGVVMGYPAKPIKEFWREQATLKGLAARRKG